MIPNMTGYAPTNPNMQTGGSDQLRAQIARAMMGAQPGMPQRFGMSGPGAQQQPRPMLR